MHTPKTLSRKTTRMLIVLFAGGWITLLIGIVMAFYTRLYIPVVLLAAALLVSFSVLSYGYHRCPDCGEPLVGRGWRGMLFAMLTLSPRHAIWFWQAAEDLDHPAGTGLRLRWSNPDGGTCPYCGFPLKYDK